MYKRQGTSIPEDDEGRLFLGHPNFTFPNSPSPKVDPIIYGPNVTCFLFSKGMLRGVSSLAGGTFPGS